MQDGTMDFDIVKERHQLVAKEIWKIRRKNKHVRQIAKRIECEGNTQEQTNSN